MKTTIALTHLDGQNLRHIMAMLDENRNERDVSAEQTIQKIQTAFAKTCQAAHRKDTTP